jgi:glycosyltransferase involved in cell wall biosynthesis
VKILNIFNHYLERGGEASAVWAISDSLSRMSDLTNCEFFSADWLGPDAPAIWKQAIWMLRNPKSIKKLYRIHQDFQPDAWLVHNVFPVGSAAIYREAKQLRIPIIQYLHNFRPLSASGTLWAGNQIQAGGLSGNYWAEIWNGAWQQSRLKTACLAAVLSLMRRLKWLDSVKAWIAISDFVRNKFIAGGVPPENLFTLRYFWRVRPNHSIEAGNGHYLFLGRLIEAKGIFPLLRTWEILEQEGSGPTPRLLIAGSGPLRQEVIRRAERMQAVSYAGELHGEAKDQAIQQARALIVPSVWWEPLGLVVYEAYDCCRPVLAAASGGLPEIVIDGQTGLLHQPGRAEQLAEQIRWMEANLDARRGMGRQGRAWLEQNASEPLWQEKFREIAAHALAQR